VGKDNKEGGRPTQAMKITGISGGALMRTILDAWFDDRKHHD
jgi:hypothetical protein